MEYELKLNEKDLNVLSAALYELPYKVSAELIHKISLQLDKETGTEDQA